MKIEISDLSGFCKGVNNAIEKAEMELGNGAILYCLGDILHNSEEVERLKNKGLQTISHTDMENIRGGKMLIRAHGEPPATYETAQLYGIEVIDCTCSVVKNLQKQIKETYTEIKKKNGQLVIFGIRGHPEVNGLVGQTNDEAIVIENEDEALLLDFTRPIYMFAQTTQSLESYNRIQQIISEKISAASGIFVAKNTICNQVRKWKSHLEKFAGKHDVIIFVSDKQSSNGKQLYKSCKDVNSHTYFIEKETEIEFDWFNGYETVGICGATSTPKWLMNNIIKKIKSYGIC
jgi:4-hydroxy-3-methylbut-2-enyl diphosphate reductase